MLLRNWNRTTGLLASLLLMGSCAQSPVSPTGSVSVTTPALLLPANGASISNLSQPITLTVSNAYVSSSTASVLYTFEVATDAAFASKVQTKTATPGTGQTSVVLSALPAGQNYFWHVRATGADTTGTFSATETFTVGPAIALGAPGAVAPLSGATPSGWPTFIVNDATKSGPVGPVTYKFEVSTSSTFTTDVLSQTVSETPNQTSFTPSLNTTVVVGTTLFWRATAIDSADLIMSPPSTPQSFVASQLTQQALIALQEGFVLWPGVQPPGTNGHSGLGGGWNPTLATSFTGVTFQSPTLEELREFDLIDRGLDPQAALDFQNNNGYPTSGLYVPSEQVVGYPYEYMFVDGDGAWSLTLRVGGEAPLVAAAREGFNDSGMLALGVVEAQAIAENRGDDRGDRDGDQEQGAPSHFRAGPFRSHVRSVVRTRQLL